MAAGAEQAIPDGAALIAGYRALPGVPDEMVDATGAIRPVWRPFLAALSRMNRAQIDKRFARADQYLRDAGVYYRVYGDATSKDRDWPLSHIPVLIDGAEWRALETGLIQRAELLEAILSDLYGPARLVAEGFLPPGLVAASPEYLRPLVGIKPAGGHHLHFVSFEVGRGPDGGWWVLGDRTQAPSGAGFALENRVATARAFSDIYGEMHVHRLAGFFRAFRDALQHLGELGEGRVAILTPGPLNETYFEHAYIARYLGFVLLQGDDLTVVDGQAMVRTVAGLRPISVLWRRMDAAFADPLELNQDSRIGTPGLVDALRAGRLAMVNALGSGLIETRAFLAFLPALSRRLLGEPLILSSIATWWCGGETERKHVTDHLDRMMIGPALSTRLPFDDTQATVLGASLRASARAAATAWIGKEAGRLVGQEAVTLSTTPAWVNGQLVPRPLSLRVFAARTPQGWTILPGGFARIGRSEDPTAITMQRGGTAADVWVVSDAPVEQTSLLPDVGLGFTRATPVSLPSRAADNLFWLGRYIERAEGLLRILRAYHGRLAETDDPDMPLLAHIRVYLDDLGIDADEPIPQSLVRNVDGAIRSAAQIRDRFSVDGWLALTDLGKVVGQFRARVTEGDDATRAVTVLLRKIAGFAGLVHENMYRFTGWRFLAIGRGIERGLHMSRLLAHLTGPKAPDGALDMMLEIGDSVMTHRRRYSVSTNDLTVLDLLALDALNPRSILYQLDEIRRETALLPLDKSGPPPSGLMREVMRIENGLAIRTPEALTSRRLTRLARDLERLADHFARTYMG